MKTSLWKRDLLLDSHVDDAIQVLSCNVYFEEWAFRVVRFILPGIFVRNSTEVQYIKIRETSIKLARISLSSKVRT
jgi:hypothetical protein